MKKTILLLLIFNISITFSQKIKIVGMDKYHDSTHNKLYFVVLDENGNSVPGIKDGDIQLHYNGYSSFPTIVDVNENSKIGKDSNQAIVFHIDGTEGINRSVNGIKTVDFVKRFIHRWLELDNLNIPTGLVIYDPYQSYLSDCTRDKAKLNQLVDNISLDSELSKHNIAAAALYSYCGLGSSNDYSKYYDYAYTPIIISNDDFYISGSAFATGYVYYVYLGNSVSNNCTNPLGSIYPDITDYTKLDEYVDIIRAEIIGNLYMIQVNDPRNYGDTTHINLQYYLDKRIQDGISTVSRSHPTVVRLNNFSNQIIRFDNYHFGESNEKIVNLTIDTNNFKGKTIKIFTDNPHFKAYPDSIEAHNLKNISIKIKFLSDTIGYVSGKLFLTTPDLRLDYELIANPSHEYNNVNQIQVISPKPESSYSIGEIIPIRWSGISPKDSVGIYYSTDNGSKWKLLTYDQTGNRYDWGGNNEKKDTSNKYKIKVIKTNSNLEITKILGNGICQNIFRSPNGDKIAVGTSSGIAIINTQTGETETNLFSVNQLLDIVWNKNENTIAARDKLNNIYVWNINESRLIFQTGFHSNVTVPVISLNLSDNGEYLAVVYWDSILKTDFVNLYPLGGNMLSKVINIGSSDSFMGTTNNSIIYIQNGKLFSYNYNLNSYDEIISFKNLEAECRDYNHDLTVFASGDSTGSVSIESINGDYKAWKAHESFIRGIKLSPDGKKVITYSKSLDTVKIWDVQTANLIGKFPASNLITYKNFDHNFTPPNSSKNQNNITTIEWESDSKAFYAVFNDNSIKEISVEPLQVIRNLGRFDNKFLQSKFSNNSNYVAALGDTLIPQTQSLTFRTDTESVLKIFDIMDKPYVKHSLIWKLPVRSFRWSPNDDKIEVISIDSTLYIWNVESGYLTKIDRGVITGDWTNDGNAILYYSYNSNKKQWFFKTYHLNNTIDSIKTKAYYTNLERNILDNNFIVMDLNQRTSFLNPLNYDVKEIKNFPSYDYLIFSKKDNWFAGISHPNLTLYNYFDSSTIKFTSNHVNDLFLSTRYQIFPSDNKIIGINSNTLKDQVFSFDSKTDSIGMSRTFPKSNSFILHRDLITYFESDMSNKKIVSASLDGSLKIAAYSNDTLGLGESNGNFTVYDGELSVRGFVIYYSTFLYDTLIKNFVINPNNFDLKIYSINWNDFASGNDGSLINKQFIFPIIVKPNDSLSIKIPLNNVNTGYSHAKLTTNLGELWVYFEFKNKSVINNITDDDCVFGACPIGKDTTINFQLTSSSFYPYYQVKSIKFSGSYSDNFKFGGTGLDTSFTFGDYWGENTLPLKFVPRQIGCMTALLELIPSSDTVPHLFFNLYGKGTIGNGNNNDSNENNESAKFDVSVQPNPTSGNSLIMYKSDYPDMLEIYLTNILGDRITTYYDNFCIDKVLAIDLNAKELNIGAYYLVINHGGNIKTIKFIKS